MHRAKKRDLNERFSSRDAHITPSVRAIEIVKLDRYVSLRNGVEAWDASIETKIGRQTGGAKFAILFLDITVAIATQKLKETLERSARLVHTIICLCSRPRQPARAVRADKRNYWATYFCFGFYKEAKGTKLWCFPRGRKRDSPKHLKRAVCRRRGFPGKCPGPKNESEARRLDVSGNL